MKINKSWIAVEATSDFPLQNMPFGVAKLPDGSISCVSRVGNTVIDLSKMHKGGYLDELEALPKDIFASNSLNDFMALGRPMWRKFRALMLDLFDERNTSVKQVLSMADGILVPIADVEMLMPVKVGDYTDFYSSIEHATNVGKMFRDPDNALLPNWKHLPVGYHGRSSSIVISGTSIHRPQGQRKAPDEKVPSFGPSRLMDFELEMAFITGNSTQLGETISIDRTEDYIFGMVIFNDLSARDIQAWEYVPLGPFLGKSFGSVISPWIITMDALEPFRTQSPKQEPAVLPYLQEQGLNSYDIQLETYIKPPHGKENLVCTSNHKNLYWTMRQQLAHQSVNGCNINVGDMYASGTISGSSEDSYGSMLELTWRGSKPLTLNDGTERKFINDNDTVIMRAYGEKEGLRIGFGESVTQILPVKE